MQLPAERHPLHQSTLQWVQGSLRPQSRAKPPTAFICSLNSFRQDCRGWDYNPCAFSAHHMTSTVKINNIQRWDQSKWPKTSKNMTRNNCKVRVENNCCKSGKLAKTLLWRNINQEPTKGLLTAQSTPHCVLHCSWSEKLSPKKVI